MLVPFDEMPASARIWIYQSDRTLSETDIETINSNSLEFLNQWAAHGNPLKSAFKLFHEKFLVISVDEQFNQASGCSIDASVSLVRQLESELNINFFDRTRISFIADGKVFDSPMSDLKELIDKGTITEETMTFNNLVQNLGELHSKWTIPVQESWLKRYF
ncbi:MAG: hypothetical protein JXR07_18640 [Reichenbachiella sp.]